MKADVFRGLVIEEYGLAAKAQADAEIEELVRNFASTSFTCRRQRKLVPF